MITSDEIIKDFKNLMAKVEYMALTYRNNEIWRQTDNKLIEILSHIEADKRIYGY